MHTLYSIFIQLFDSLLPLLGVFSEKLKTFYTVRKDVFDTLEGQISQNERIIWVHAASLGEYEQGVPVMEALKKQFPQHKLLLTFFSPSGYTQKKNNPISDFTTYLPLDTSTNAKRFVNIVKPEMAFFIKYEFWPNYLNELDRKSVKTYLISAVFRRKQLFFKWYGTWMKKSLHAFDHFFVQDQKSIDLVKTLGFQNVSLSGDTRFDRVSKQLEMDNSLQVVEAFKNGMPLLVCGSTWPEDELLLLDYINKHAAQKVKILVAPHQIQEGKIDQFMAKIGSKVAKYSQHNPENLADTDVFILDTIGMLGRAYSYADVAYVGGAAGKTGMHNILEPATFGIPILTGTQIDKFPEAEQLRRIAGLFTVESPEETTEILKKLFADISFRQNAGMIAGHYVQQQTGATQIILNYLEKNNAENPDF
ncbi:3-deoxy-D-manno-octulosonic acid transferase [Flavimarina sp. Hel_I_48]|uniref:3-deoxy-D-manno-octulosonic acid transferase n=1 Tax=Flavimarina sp. Hel_I_48 TaxID=1392488 RepID=UPI0004DFB8F0|nr:glycosyltransferase N-terminal domain-containing protein [Flavimarina sp. Hel_I_48]